MDTRNSGGRVLFDTGLRAYSTLLKFDPLRGELAYEYHPRNFIGREFRVTARWKILRIYILRSNTKERR